jgi:KUP system potassium uptake protein
MRDDETPAGGNDDPHGTVDAHPIDSAKDRKRFWALSIGSVGVVYGDIGTSPLYAFRESLVHSAEDGFLTRAEVLGVVSLLLWSLIIIVTLKYVLFLLRADNRGEGGTLSLLALAEGAIGRRTTFVFILATIGTSLFYGDAIITPAISVLSALEGINTVTPAFSNYVVPMTIAVLTVLFVVQQRGSGTMARWFGPIMVVWFVVIGLLGLRHIFDDPNVLYAFNPVRAVSFVAEHGIIGFVVLGSVFLAVTGAEALYADMGHFGRKPIRFAWLALVFPSLSLNYLGQGALVLAEPEALENPFFLMAPEWGRVPFILLATAATVIASQAVITGAFSLTQQAVQLGLLPRFEIRHTSATEAGQIYLPRLNYMMLAGVILLVLTFQTSGDLASAYGIAVTGTMVMTSLLSFILMWKVWRWPPVVAAAIAAPFFIIECFFLAANLLKLLDGGYVPLVLAFGVVLTMITWVRGTRIVFEKSRRESVRVDALSEMLQRSESIQRVVGTAVFLTSDREVAPSAFLHNLKHNHVLHEKNIILTVKTARQPRVPESRRTEIEKLDDNITRIGLTFGFMETPNVPKALAACRKQGVKFDIMSTSFFLSRRLFRASPTSGLPRWQDKFFIRLTRYASNATDFYHLPAGRVVEMGQQISV